MSVIPISNYVSIKTSHTPVHSRAGLVSGFGSAEYEAFKVVDTPRENTLSPEDNIAIHFATTQMPTTLRYNTRFPTVIE